MLVLASLWDAQSAGQKLLTLEVRASNTAAIALYRACGLGCIGRRPKYYRNPPEEALLLARFFGVRPLEEAYTTFLDPHALESSQPHTPAPLDALVGACGDAESIILRAGATSRRRDAEHARAVSTSTLGVLLGDVAR